MATKVATTTQTQLTHASPLKVPRRPPRNDITQAIQKFLPYAIVFLLSLMIYSSFKNANISSPSYYPPNSAPSTNNDLSSFARDHINSRAQRLQELKSRSEQSSNVQVSEWTMWMEQKADELRSKLAAAKSQLEQGVENMQKSSVLNMKMNEMKQTVAAHAGDFVSEVEQTIEEPIFVEESIDSIDEDIERVRESIAQEEAALREEAFVAEWDTVSSVEEKADIIAYQIRLLGDDVVNTLLRKLNSEACNQCQQACM